MARFRPITPVDATIPEKVDSYSRADEAHEVLTDLWKEWSDWSGRPLGDTSLTYLSVAESIGDMLIQENYPELVDRVRLALYLPPVDGDVYDEERFINILTDDDVYESAIAHKDMRDQVYTYEDIAEQGLIPASTVLDLLGRDTVPVGQEKAFQKLRRMSLSALKKRVDRTLSWTGLTVLTPNDVVAQSGASDMRKKTVVSPRQQSHVYESYPESVSDESGDDSDGSEFLSFDDRAMVYVNQGRDGTDILEFHNRAPEGYWQSVKEWCADHMGELTDAYASLMDTYQWHPDERPLLKG